MHATGPRAGGLALGASGGEIIYLCKRFRKRVRFLQKRYPAEIGAEYLPEHTPQPVRTPVFSVRTAGVIVRDLCLGILEKSSLAGHARGAPGVG